MTSVARTGRAASGDPGADAGGQACLNASALLVRRAWRCPNREDEQLLLRMAQVLDALHRSAHTTPADPPDSGSAGAPLAASSAVPRAITRLAEQLERLERTPHHPGADPAVGPGPGGGR